MLIYNLSEPFVSIVHLHLNCFQILLILSQLASYAHYLAKNGELWKMYRSLSTAHNTPQLTRAPLGYFYNAPHWGGGEGGYFEPPSDLRNYWADSKKFKLHLKALEKLTRENKFC